MIAIKGQIVPGVKSYLPRASRFRLGQNVPMRELMTPAEFVELYIARTKRLREMTLALGVPYERYKKYETRTPLPHELVERFALITRVPIEFVITGRTNGVAGLPRVPGPDNLDEHRAAKMGESAAKK